MSEPRAALSLIFHPDSQQRILCVWNRRYKGWGLPGGKVEDGEDLETAQARELLEETGLDTTSAELVYEAPTVTSDTGRIVHVFRVVPTTFPLKTPYVFEEDSEVDWQTPLDLLNGSPFKEFYHAMFTKVLEAADVDHR